MNVLITSREARNTLIWMPSEPRMNYCDYKSLRLKGMFHFLYHVVQQTLAVKIFLAENKAFNYNLHEAYSRYPLY